MAKIDNKERVALIRKGNELFNNGEIDKAIKIFIQTDYKDGLARAGDYYFYDKKAPLMAFKYYKMANMHDRVNEIFKRMIFALGRWIGEDKVKDLPEPPKKEFIQVKVSPKLKILAEEIIRDSEKKQ
ncbi:MAG: hypothetical protein MUC95_01780 [Spirochaetes bacterium]|jgi:hypothetical protein|nr:hypothetical protein [Spirochaetota bacterium]